METPLYNSASTRTRRSMRRYKGKYGHIHAYKPKRQLAFRWMEENGMTYEQMIEQVRKERKYLIQQFYGIDDPIIL